MTGGKNVLGGIVTGGRMSGGKNVRTPRTHAIQTMKHALIDL